MVTLMRSQGNAAMHTPISRMSSTLCVILSAVCSALPVSAEPIDHTAGTSASVSATSETQQPTFNTPLIEGYGAIMPFPGSAEPPRAGSRIIFDIAGASEPEQVIKGLNSVALFLNLAADAGIPPEKLRLAAVLHGAATRAVLRHEAYAKETKTSRNPNLDLIQKLKRAGVELFVCGQALAHRHYGLDDVTSDVTVASSATTVNVNKQMDGYAYLPFH